jgi:hypothetical protein
MESALGFHDRMEKVSFYRMPYNDRRNDMLACCLYVTPIQRISQI